MMKRTLLLTTFLLFPHFLLFSQNTLDYYTSHWSEVYKLELKKLPKSALEITDSIYTTAKSEQNYPQIVKALIYKAKFTAAISENHELLIVKSFTNEIAYSNGPLKNILENLLAKIYRQYYQSNRWKFYQRSRTEEKINENDFRTWDLNTLFNEIHIHFQRSLENDQMLRKIELKEIEDILVEQHGSKQYRPTLFDLIAHNALKFYSTPENGLIVPANRFEIRDPRYFRDIKDLEIPPPTESISLQYNALKIYQELIRFHEANHETSALIVTELERLEFVKANGVMDDVELLYKRALEGLKTKNRDHPASTLIDYALANLFYDQGLRYQYDRDQENQFKKREALELCRKAIRDFPESTGAVQCQHLADKILNPALSLTSESFIPIDHPSRILVKYANVDVLAFSVYKISQDRKEKFVDLRNDTLRLSFIRELPEVSQWNFKLKNLDDYQEHTTETILQALPQGQYLIVAHVADDQLTYGYCFLQVTNLVLIENSMDGFTRYQVVDRNNGTPIEGAHVRLVDTYKRNDRSQFNQVKTSDYHGFFTDEHSDSYYRYLIATISTQEDTAVFGDFYLPRKYSRQAKDRDELLYAKAFLFTDRSIYRPGQKVYFKGILTQRQGDHVSIVTGEYVEVYLYDPNDSEVAFLRLKTNDFGSFSGEFDIPTSGMTGEYYISVDEDYEEDSKFYDELLYDFESEEARISVEEYKRPKFEASFDPVLETFRLSDTITIKGKASAFTGATVSGAKVVYHVNRSVRYPDWYYWGFGRNYQSTEAMEIAFGESQTAADGTFTLSFKAIPDESVDPNELPVFEYVVNADITDLNGETQSAETVVRVGYHTMNLSINAPGKLLLDTKSNPITVGAQNLNGQKINADGIVKIFQLPVNDRLCRKRPWPSPDLQVITEEDFIRLFPHDIYDSNQHPNEKDSDSENRPIYQTTFNTEKSDTVQLEIDKSWTPGSYQVIVESRDPFGQLVQDKHKFSLEQSDKLEIRKDQVVIAQIDATNYQQGDTAIVTIGSAADDIAITIDIEKNHEITSSEIVHLSNSSAELKVPITDTDTEGFAVHYSSVCFNGMNAGVLVGQISRENEEIEIEVTTFRDKLQPSGEETWNFEIKGSDREQVEAEMLASMYDASLDQFKAHNWTFSPFRRQGYYSYNRSRSNQSFGSQHFMIRNLRNLPYYPDRLIFDEFDWFGFSITNNEFVTRQYLNRLMVTYTDTVRQQSKITITNDANKKEGFIYGMITNHSGESLPGVNVVIKGTSRGTVTDLNGSYTIQASKGEELVFSYVGYVTTNAKVGSGNTIDVELGEDVTRLSEVTVVGYGVQKKANLTGSVVTIVDDAPAIEEIVFEEVEEEVADMIFSVNDSDGVAYRMSIRGIAPPDDDSGPLYVLDGKIVDRGQISQDDLANISVLKGEAASAIYGERAANGVIIITTKSGQKKLDTELAKIQARSKLQELAFFYPHLKTDESGKISFSFTTPEALTRWKLQLLAHNKNLASSIKTLQTVTTKDLMVIPNAPRFLRVGDEVVISAKITNLSDEALEGVASLQLVNPFTNDVVDDNYENFDKNKSFTAMVKGNTEVSWRINIPEGVGAVQYKIVAKSGSFSDGEQSIMPVLSNRMLVTETLPMHIKFGQTKTFVLDKLKNTTSPTLQHHLLTLEVTSNPAWYALQALPYLMEFPHECSEQLFSRYYANVLGVHILNSNASIREVFEKWASEDGLSSNLEKNEELKSIMIQETPWLRDAMSETQQKKRIAELFDRQKLKSSLEAAIYKLEQMQLSNGGFPWFSGSNRPNRFITQHIVAGLAHLLHLQVDFESHKTYDVLKKGLKFLDGEILKDYSELLDLSREPFASAERKENFMDQRHILAVQLQYLYIRSFFPDSLITDNIKPAVDYYRRQSSDHWKDFGIYEQAMVALVQFKSGEKQTAKDILASLKETSISSEEMGMYWKSHEDSWQWNHAPIETQALLIEAFSDIEGNDDDISEQEKVATIDNLKIWLLKNKQTNRWSTTKSTTEAIYALLLQGSKWLSVSEQVEVFIGSEKLNINDLKDQPETGTGYYETSWLPNQIDDSLGSVTLSKKQNGVAWGGLYWQYFEDLDKITSSETGLKLTKKVFKVTNSSTGEVLSEVGIGTGLNVGDLVRIRIELTADREMEFIHMKDMRAAGLEPVNVLSQYKWQDGLGYYESTRDASANFFIDHLPKGVYVFEYDLRVNNRGNFSNGITTIQSMYAPEFSSHSEGIRLGIE
jgi:TonB-dependent SusC/RagA subfamily outer membrane receptor